MVATDETPTYWVHEPARGAAWRVVAHNADITRMLELGLRASWHERVENDGSDPSTYWAPREPLSLVGYHRGTPHLRLVGGVQ